MKNTILISFILIFSKSILLSQDTPLRGPFNQPSNGVIDGVVIKEELPTRSIIPYQHVRAADYVWSKRLYSRIDAREKINQVLFLPFDSFDGGVSGTSYNPKNELEVDAPSWNKDQSRWSLWTIIFRHVLLGDLTVYKVASDTYQDLEDGYSLKYPIIQKPYLNRKDYFLDSNYRKEINELISLSCNGDFVIFDAAETEGEKIKLVKTNQSSDVYIDSMLQADSDNASLAGINRVEFKSWWDATKFGEDVRKNRKILNLASNSIFGYNIKEDWFFDKQRSLIDRRIISIAPLARYTFDDKDASFRGELLVYDKDGKCFNLSAEDGFEEYDGKYEEREIFWLYFPELRNVIVNYFIYNDKSDAQWMSFDDMFWKRQFNAQIYKTSDKFDREIEDYKYGVDALYEAERLKDEIRKWEMDVWNY